MFLNVVGFFGRVGMFPTLDKLLDYVNAWI